jgi:hypothetical protein
LRPLFCCFDFMISLGKQIANAFLDVFLEKLLKPIRWAADERCTIQ